MSQAVITLKGTGGILLAGTVRSLRADMLTIELIQPLEPGSTFEWRMELTGHPETVAGSMRVVSSRSSDSESYRILGQLSRMSTQDRDRLKLWIREQRTGGTTRRYDSSVVSGVSTWTHGQHASASETRAALARLNERRRHISSSNQAADLLGLSSEVDTASSKDSGRQALRSALRQSMVRKRQRAQESNTTRGALPRWAQNARGSLRTTPDPEVVRIPHTQPTRLQIRYHDPARYAREYTQNISRYALSLPLPDLGQSGTMLSLSIIPPKQSPVTCDAEVKVQMTSGVGVALMLNKEQLEQLKPNNKTP